MILPKIIGFFKMNTAKKINLIRNSVGCSVWQKDYFEHIVRNEHTLKKIRKYIEANPLRWEYDIENPQAKAVDPFNSWILNGATTIL